MGRAANWSRSVVVTATGSVSSGNLSGVDVIASKAREISVDDIVSIGNEETKAQSRLTQLEIAVMVSPVAPLHVNCTTLYSDT